MISDPFIAIILAADRLASLNLVLAMTNASIASHARDYEHTLRAQAAKAAHDYQMEVHRCRIAKASPTNP